MSLTDLFLFTWRALGGHRLRTALSVLGVVIGVCSVVLLTGLGEGARTYVTSQLATLGSDLIIVLPGKVETTGAVPFAGGVPNDLTLEDVRAIQRISTVERATPITLGQASVAYRGLSRHIPVFGTTSDFQSIRRITLSKGIFLPPGDLDRGSPVCVIGLTVEKELFRGENPVGKIIKIDEWRFRIIGVLQHKGQSLGTNLDDLVFIPVATAMKMFNQTSVFRLLVESGSYQALERVKKDILKEVRSRHRAEDVTLITQDAVLSSFNQIFVALTLALAGIAGISLTVAGIGIMNVMLVSVSERTAEIGLMKAVGVTTGQIVTVFLAEAALLSVIGGVIGLVSAHLLIRLLEHVYPALPAQVPDWAVAAALLVALGVGLLFGVWPARRASRLDPILALGRR
jgi:putative ABC transport system permease protein